MPAASFLDFLKLGVGHIFTGYDHLFFLFGLLLVCTRWRQLLAVVTSFTAGHSLTLALATLDLVRLPTGWVEPLIALTILWIGAENCWRRDEVPPTRWALALVFGFVHGFGFATVLREVGVGAGGRGIAGPLVGFNLGVELGQLVFAAMVLPAFWTARRHPAFTRRWVPGLSAVIALAGLYWFLERLLHA